MSENKCCGNCKHMENQDLDGFGWCKRTNTETHCALHYDCHEDLNGWTEITPDTESSITEELAKRIIIGCIDCCGEMHTTPLIGYYIGIGTMAKIGGYYYYVLPELKISNEQEGTNQAI